MIDNFIHQGLRNKMVLYLKEECQIKNDKVLDAMGRVPRHFFLDSSFLDFAYQDKAFPIGDNQTISSIYTVAFQSQLLNTSTDEKILEIGTGSGYQTAVLAEMSGDIYSIERHRSLYKKAKNILKKMHYRVNLIYGDGYIGSEINAPFDKILVTCGASKVPPALLSQLKIGGIMVIPVGDGEQVMTVITKNEDGSFSQEEHSNFKFVPLLRDKT